MSAPTKTDANAISATTARIESQVAARLKSVDSTAAQRIQNLSLVHQARLTQLKRTAASVTAQYGASSTQATAAEAAVTATKATIARIAIVKQQATTTTPQVAGTGWALHGRVYNSQLQPVSTYSVFLVDAQKAYQGTYGFAYTDSTGYFLLSFAGTPATPQSETQQSPQAAQPAPQTPSQLFVEIANSKSLPVYLSSTAFRPTLGVATYQNITLPAGEKPIGDPPPAIAAVALPPVGKIS
jgi:hypothetical protein